MGKPVWLLVFIWLVLLVPNFAGANGGPVAWSKIGPDGGVMPRQESVIRLAGETLRIRLHDDQIRYTVTADYVLNNPGQTRAVLYGVPLTWEAKRSAEVVAKDINLQLNGVRHICRVADISRGGKPERDRQYLLTEEHGESGKSKWGTAWCVANLEIAGGRDSTLRLQYTAELEYVDMITTKSARVGFAHRQLHYALWPAGKWKGNVGNFRIDIHLGPYAGFLHKHNFPPSTHIKGDRITYSAKNIDLNSFASIQLEFSARPLHAHQELATWNKKAEKYSRVPVKVRASSHLPNHGSYRFDPPNVSDGDPKTAWCVSKPDDGRGAWLEITALRSPAQQPPNRLQCRLEGVALVPGFAHSQQLYLANNRIRRFRMARCDDPANYRDVDILNRGNRFDTSAVFLPLDDEDLPTWWEKADLKYTLAGRSAPRKKQMAPASCWRLTILEIDRGEKYRDTCISEFALIVNCP